jgi:hypothetical protein
LSENPRIADHLPDTLFDTEENGREKGNKKGVAILLLVHAYFIYYISPMSYT